ncbi:MAG: 30S ribosomal protein S1 [Planctomycetota bacterium]
MVNKNIMEEVGLKEQEITSEVEKIIGDYSTDSLTKLYEESIKEFKTGSILKGKILNILGNDVIVDVGYKSEGLIPLHEFPEPESVKVGDGIDVFLESVEDESGLIVLSKSRADRLHGWERIIKTCKEGDTVKGKVTRKIKGGLLVDIGIPVFLPASQSDVRRIQDIGKLIGQVIECKVIQIDTQRMNIIVSRRKLLEEQRTTSRNKLFAEAKEGEVVSGVVKNIADFGVFIDLGGVDGLLHITDMNWGRVSHPSELVTMDQKIDVKILRIDREKNRIALGLKQLSPNPWENINDKYPVATKVKGKIVNILPYGAFVELNPGIEGLIHISEMSWTKRITHPSEMVAIGDIVETVVISVNPEKQEISLGMKQLEENPWMKVAEKYKVGAKIHGRVRNITSYGAFIEIEEGIDGLLHVSDISWTKKVTKPADVIKKGDKIEAVILSIDPEKKRVSLGVKQLTPNPWETIIPEKYKVGNSVSGKIIKMTASGAVVELEPNLEGYLQLSKPTPLAERLTNLSPDVISGQAGEGGEKEESKKIKAGDTVNVIVAELQPEECRIILNLPN